MVGMGDLGKLMKEAQKLQEKMQQLQAELSQKEVSGTSGGGMVTVLATGNQQVKSIQIEKEVIDPDDPEMLQDLITAAVNDALERSRELQKKELGGLTGGLNIPGLF